MMTNYSRILDFFFFFYILLQFVRTLVLIPIFGLIIENIRFDLPNNFSKNLSMYECHTSDCICIAQNSNLEVQMKPEFHVSVH